jgi:hypothetical protein
MKENIKTIIEWHEQTFPDATLDGQKAKFEEEIAEYNESVCMEELADMFIVACGIARFDSVAAIEYFVAVFQGLLSWKTVGAYMLFKITIDEKMAKNRKRKWNKANNGSYHHIADVSKKD